MAKDDLNLAPDGKAGGKKKLIIIILAALLLLGGGGGATWYFLMQDKPSAEEGASDKQSDEDGDAEDGEEGADDAEMSDKEPRYYPLAPPFVINFPLRDGMHYLQVDLQAMSYNPKAIEKLKAHSPAVRNDIILLFSSQDYRKLNTLEGKEELRQAALDRINETLKFKKKSNMINDLYFTSFMMQ